MSKIIVYNNFDLDARDMAIKANINNPVEQNALNYLVSATKAAGIWDLVPVMYPMVGGTAASCKWNLKDRRDLDAAFRLTFAGGWTFSSTGAKPNGSNAYARTYWIPSVQGVSDTGGHLSYYSRTNSLRAQRTMGAEDGTDSQPIHLLMGYSNNVDTMAFGNVSPGNWGRVDPPCIDGGRGFFQLNRDGTTTHYERNNVVVGTSLGTMTAPPTIDIYLGNTGIPGYGPYPSRYSDKECAFASIGAVGLTQAQALQYEAIIKQFNTMLGRQVSY